MSYSYVTDSMKTFLNDQFNNLQTTFGRPITIYRTAEHTVLVENPDNNYLYADTPFNSTTTTVVQSGVVNACILYSSRENLTQFNSVSFRNSAEQNQIRLEEGEVRIRLDPTGIALLEGCQRVQFDGTIFNVVTSKRPHGLFTPNFNDYYLKKLN